MRFAGSEYGFLENADALAIGCLLAMRHGRTFDFVLSRSFALCCVMLVVLISSMAHYFPRFEYIIGQSITVIAFAAIIEHVIRRPPNFLNFAPLMYVGRISYSLYLWQQIALSPYPTPIPQRIVQVIIIFAFAAVSYHVIEKPILNWRDRRPRAI